MSKPIAVPARPGPSHTPILASADDTMPSQPVSLRPARSRRVLVTITVTKAGIHVAPCSFAEQSPG